MDIFYKDIRNIIEEYEKSIILKPSKTSIIIENFFNSSYVSFRRTRWKHKMSIGAIFEYSIPNYNNDVKLNIIINKIKELEKNL